MLNLFDQLGIFLPQKTYPLEMGLSTSYRFNFSQGQDCGIAGSGASLEGRTLGVSRW